ncbi:MAG: hypothetical protein AABZ09_09675 [Candidatus Binatota bacterium]
MPKSESTYLPSVHLHLEDLEAIVQIVGEAGAGVTIADKSHEFTSFEEMRQHRGDTITNLKIVGRSPYVSVEFQRWPPFGHHLYTSEQDTRVIGAFHRIYEILRKRQSILSKVFPRPLPTIAFFSFWILTSIRVADLQAQSLLSITGYLLFIIFFAGGLGNSGLLTTISLRRQHEAMSFFARRRDDLLLAIVSAILGGVVTLILSKYFG